MARESVAPAAPDVRVSVAPGPDQDAAIERAMAILHREGVVILDDLVDPALIARCRAEIDAACPDKDTPDPERYFGSYPGRYTVPLVIEGAIADPALCIAPVVDRIAAHFLGGKYKVNSTGVLVSIPGAPDQNRHPDAKLFPESNLDGLLAPFAIAFALPLVTMDEVSGRTAFWTRSHRNPKWGGPWDVAETVHPGSAILWDYRIHHQGLANHGATARTVLYSALCRHWWIEVEPQRHSRYVKLQMAREVYAALDPELQSRFSRATLIDTTEFPC